MSLRLWAPLAGDLRQIGASNAVLTNDGATVDNNGKIGKCYAFANTHIIVDSTDIQDILSSTTQPFSMACWIYLNSDETDRVIIFGNYSANPFVNWELAANGTQRLCAGGTSNYTNKYNSTAVPKTTWTHIAVTYDGNVTTFYQNGILTNTPQTGANTLTTKTANSRFYLGSDVRNDATRLKGKLNDFRFYDHCLSAAEVHEIAQGLVLHYKLDDPNPNLLLSTPKSYTPNSYCGYQLNFTENLVSGQTYTLQLWDVLVEHSAKTAAEMNLCAYWGGGSVVLKNFNGASNFEILRDHYAYSSHLVATFTISSSQASGNGATNAWFNMYNSVGWVNGTVNMHIGAWKLEKGNIATPWTPNNIAEITDSSGYEHHGTASGTISLSSDTARYSYSTVFNGSNTKIQVPNLTPSELTISFWMKRNANTGTRQFMYTAWSGITCELQTNGTPTFAVYRTNYPTITGTAITTDSGWVHYCATFDTINGSKLYQNGVLKSSNNNVTPIAYSISTNYIGYYNTYYNGLMSDFRIYCTALSADDVLQLYHTSAKIDNKHKIHSFEFNENSQDKITKTGQLQGSALTEFNGMSYLKYDSNLYIEPDGSCWVRVFHHNNPGAGSFSSGNDFAHSVYIDENRWFNVELANYLDKWEIMVKGKFTATSDEWKLRWIQQYNPMTATYENVAVANITKITNGYSSSPTSWGGLYFKNGSTYLCANNGTNGNWWGAVGSYSVYQNGIPGWGPSGTITTTGFNDVYLRIDNVTFTTPTAKNTKNKIWAGSEFIEL